MHKNLAAWTPPGLEPPFVSINEISPGVVELHVRARRRNGQMSADQVQLVLTEDEFKVVFGKALAKLYLANIGKECP